VQRILPQRCGAREIAGRFRLLGVAGDLLQLGREDELAALRAALQARRDLRAAAAAGAGADSGGTRQAGLGAAATWKGPLKVIAVPRLIFQAW
jgi:hypothetical protein